MIKKILLSTIVAFAFILLSISAVSAGDTITVQVDIVGDTVSVNVPNSIYLGNVSRGYKTNDSINITIANTGNTKVKITPQLTNPSGIFSNLYMKRIKSDAYKKYDSFSMNISRPNELNGIEYESLYLMLDLSNYNGSLSGGVNRMNENVRFIATST